MEGHFPFLWDKVIDREKLKDGSEIVSGEASGETFVSGNSMILGLY